MAFLPPFSPLIEAPTSSNQCLAHAVYYLLEAWERLTIGCDLLSLFCPCWRTFIAFFTSATFKTPVVLPPFAPAVQYA